MGLADNVQMVLGSDFRSWLVPSPVDDDALETCRGGLSYHPDEHEELMQVLRMEGKSAADLVAAVLGPAWYVLHGGGPSETGTPAPYLARCRTVRTRRRRSVTCARFIGPYSLCFYLTLRAGCRPRRARRRLGCADVCL